MPDDIEIIYLAWNRRAFTELSFELLLANTPWDRVSRLRVYDDGSSDGTREWLAEAIRLCPVEHELHDTRLGSPPATMNEHVATARSEWFMKCDSDIALPPGWLEDATAIIAAKGHPEILGLAAGWTGVKDGPPSYEPARHIGGVGLMKVEALRRYGRIGAEGRQGWTQFQEKHRSLSVGWAKPDIQAVQLDLVPAEPWALLAAEYVERGWARHWQPYTDPSLWQWIQETVAA